MSPDFFFASSCPRELLILSITHYFCATNPILLCAVLPYRLALLVLTGKAANCGNFLERLYTTALSGFEHQVDSDQHGGLDYRGD